MFIGEWGNENIHCFIAHLVKNFCKNTLSFIFDKRENFKTISSREIFSQIVIFESISDKTFIPKSTTNLVIKTCKKCYNERTEKK